MKTKILGLSLGVLLCTTAVTAYAQTLKDEYVDLESRAQVFDSPSGGLEAQGPIGGGGPAGPVPGVIRSFEGISQFDVASFGRNFIPPDTMGAVGKTQYMEMVNGGVAVYDKATGVRTAIMSDVAFWASVGQAGANGDQRVMYNAQADRWIAIGFGASVADIEIAVSDTSNALGGWKSTKFTGFNAASYGLFNGVADYPTLALDNNAVYIGTNNFAASTPGGSQTFRGTTLNVIPLTDLFNAGAPNAAGRSIFNAFYNTPGKVTDLSRGFAIQGVNSQDGDSTGDVLVVSAVDDSLVRYNVNNAGTPGATETAAIGGLGGHYDGNGPGRQPAVGSPGNGRVIDTLDDRVSSSVYKVNGLIYSVHTVTELGSDHTYVRWDIIDAATNAVLDEGDIGDGVHDFFQGSLAVNEQGQVVIAYNRSGSDAADGKISFLARQYNTHAGKLFQIGSELLLKVSVVDDYHNGSVDGQPAAGRQRWGDYSAVSLDPTDHNKFWVIGEFAREYNDAKWGHPGGTGGSRWGTFIAELGAGAVPEPQVWAMMVMGFGFAGAALRRRRRAVAA